MKKNITTILLAVLFILSAVSISYGYFTDDKNVATPEFNADISNDAVTVLNEIDLRMVSVDDKFNSIFPTSITTTRRKIKLGSNIILSSDLNITADCNIDLNNFELDLNGYNVLISHNYYGEFVIHNGKIVDNNLEVDGSLSINTPNAAYKIDLTQAFSNINLVAFNENYIINDIKSTLAKRISHGETLNYFWSDLDLLFNYYSYGAEFEYQSTNPQVLDKSGKATPTISGKQVVTLTANITINQTTYSENYIINIIHKDNTAEWLNAGLDLFENFFQKYSDVVDGDYSVYNDITLPVVNNYISTNGNFLNYTYKAYQMENPNDGTLAEEINGQQYYQLPADSIYSNGSILKSNRAEIYLKVTSNIGSESLTESSLYKIKVFSHADLYDYINEILATHYSGGNIIIREEGIGYTTFDLPLNLTVFNEKYNVTAIEHRLLSGYSYYKILNDVTLMVKGDEPDPLTKEFLEIKITFGTANPIAAMATISYEKSDKNFMPYYKYIDNLILDRTGDYTTFKNFSIISSYYGKLPVVGYTLSAINEQDNEFVGNGKAISIKLKVDGIYKNDYVIGNDGTNITNIEWLISLTSSWDIVVDLTKVPDKDVLIKINYHYSFQNKWQTYEDGTDLTLKGLVYKPSNKINGVLFDKLYSQYASADTSGNIILISELATPKEKFEIKDSTGITSYKGIEYLKGTSKLYLGELNANYTVKNISNVKDSDVAYITQLTQLTHLSLIGAGSTTGNSSNSITSLTPFLVLTNLQELTLPYNNIQYFDDIPKFNPPISIYIYKNITKRTFWGFDLGSNIWGSEGFTSKNHFYTATVGRPTFNIYNTLANNLPVRFDPNNHISGEAFTYFSDTMYQDKVETGVSATKVIEKLATLTNGEYLNTDFFTNNNLLHPTEKYLNPTASITYSYYYLRWGFWKTLKTVTGNFALKVKINFDETNPNLIVFECRVASPIFTPGDSGAEQVNLDNFYPPIIVPLEIYRI